MPQQANITMLRNLKPRAANLYSARPFNQNQPADSTKTWMEALFISRVVYQRKAARKSQIVALLNRTGGSELNQRTIRIVAFPSRSARIPSEDSLNKKLHPSLTAQPTQEHGKKLFLITWLVDDRRQTLRQQYAFLYQLLTIGTDRDFTFKS